MPTNVSHPIWQCDICMSRFDQNLAAAQRCEDAGPPELLEDGELLLLARRSGPVFELARLQRQERLGTHTRPYGDEAGHYGIYQTDIESRETGMSDKPRYHSDELWPHDPAQHWLNVSLSMRHRQRMWPSRSNYHYYTAPELAGWALELVGLPHDPEQVTRAKHTTSRLRLVKPIPPEVRAVYDMLQASVPGLTTPNPPVDPEARAVVAAEHVGRRDHLPGGVFDHNRLQWWLAQQPSIDDLHAEMVDRQRRWWDGEPVLAPRPKLRSWLRRGMSASKLNKVQKAIVEATGVPWPERTGADDYLRLVTDKLLGETMTRVDDGSPHQGQALFLSARRQVAVTSTKGGVGKTTVAGALAAALAGLGERVLLVDLNLTNPGQDILWGGLGLVATDPLQGLLLPTVVLAPPEVPGVLQVFSHGQLAPDTDPAAQTIDATKITEWLTFLAGTLDLAGATPEDAVTTVVFDLPPGWDQVHQAVFGSTLAVTDCVHVTTAHPLAIASEYLPAKEADSRDRVRHWLVENLSRAQVTTADGERVEGHLYGGQGAVQDLAEQVGVRYGGSLPWQPDPAQLATSKQLRALAEAILNGP